MENITLMMIKPDAVENGHIGNILEKVTSSGFQIKALKLTQLSKIDAKRFSIKAKNTNSELSVSIGFLRDDAHLAVKTSVNLLHEIFNNFLVEGPYQNYMVEVFNLPEE